LIALGSLAGISSQIVRHLLELHGHFPNDVFLDRFTYAMIAPAYISVGVSITASFGGGLTSLPTHSWWRAHAGSISYFLSATIPLISAAAEDVLSHTQPKDNYTGTTR
jgi:hypothetical protein